MPLPERTHIPLRLPKDVYLQVSDAARTQGHTKQAWVLQAILNQLKSSTKPETFSDVASRRQSVRGLGIADRLTSSEIEAPSAPKLGATQAPVVVNVSSSNEASLSSDNILNYVNGSADSSDRRLKSTEVIAFLKKVKAPESLIREVESQLKPTSPLQQLWSSFKTGG